MRDFLRIGEIISHHGIKGEVKVYPTTDDIKRFDKLTTFYIIKSNDAEDSEFDGAETYEKESVKYFKNIVILKIKGFDSIEESAALIRKNIYVRRIDAVELKDNEFFVVDLIGMSVYMDHERIGEVLDILKTKAGDLLLVKHKDKEIMIPLVDEYILGIDTKAGKVTAKNIEGLI